MGGQKMWQRLLRLLINGSNEQFSEALISTQSIIRFQLSRFDKVPIVRKASEEVSGPRADPRRVALPIRVKVNFRFKYTADSNFAFHDHTLIGSCGDNGG